ncbi:MAG: undecaprenyl/decaprenyl-phosphate alpha-N-acetylglucosaminyl 1-phosphate transferase [Acidobacteria bacterium]|nr:undecaprenyl/decaprenyl-phosphate alpha-N-acetylglucosaminyl 1-phosphate transferase [Acidobacteriota bacterium]
MIPETVQRVLSCKVALICLISALVCGAALPFLVKVAPRLRLMDFPDYRKTHTKPTPSVGGLGMALGLGIALSMIHTSPQFILHYVTANILILALGLYDDTKLAGPSLKLFVQIVAALVIAWGTGLRFTFGTPYLQFMNAPVLSLLLTCLWIVGITNAINLIDGMDGLAGGLAFFSFGALTVVGIERGSYFFSLLAASFTGVISAFLLFNIPKAKTFMGDTGSQFLGFNIGIISIAVSMKTGAALGVILPVLFVAIPVLDTFMAIWRRLWNHDNPLTHPDRNHLHHKLLGLNFSTKQALVIFYVFAFLFSILAISSIRTGILVFLITFLMLLYGLLATLYFLEKQQFKQWVDALNRSLDKIEQQIKVNSPSHKKLDKLAVQFMMITAIIFIALSLFPSGHHTLTLAVTSLLVVAFYAISLIASNIRDNGNFVLGFSYFWLYTFIFYQMISSPILNIMLFALFLMAIPLLVYAIIIKRYVNIFFPEPIEPMIAFIIYILYQSGTLNSGRLTEAIAAASIAYLLHKGIYKNDIEVTREFQLIHLIIALMIPIFMFTGYRSAHNGKLQTQTPGITKKAQYDPLADALPDRLIRFLCADSHDSSAGK